jgi:hypothetical protein
MFPATGGGGILAFGVDGFSVSDINGAGGAYAFTAIPPSGGAYVASGHIDQLFWDIPATYGIRLDSTNGIVGGLVFDQPQINGGANDSSRTTANPLFYATDGTGQPLGDIKIVAGRFIDGASHGMEILATVHARPKILITGCSVLSNGGSGIYLFGNGFTLTDNIIDDNVAYGVNAPFFPVNGNWTGGEVLNNGTAPYNVDGLGGTSEFVFANVRGISNVSGGSISSASSITAGLNPSFTITGTTTVNTINGTTNGGYRGQILTLYKTDSGTLTIGGGGGNVPGAHTLTQNQSLTLRLQSDGNWY